jgi:hypothetical protein
MLHKKGVNWAKLHPVWKNGSLILKKDRVFEFRPDIIITENRECIEQYMKPLEE